MTEAQPPSIHRDIVSAYLASGAKIGSWLVVSALVYRKVGAEAFAMLALCRATIGLLNYTSLGLAPAMVRMLAQAQKPVPIEPVRAGDSSHILSYARLRPAAPPIAIYSNALCVALLSAVIGLGLVIVYAAYLFDRNEVGGALALLLGIGAILRIASDAPGATLQVNEQIAKDNYLNVSAEVVWALFTAGALLNGSGRPESAPGLAYVVAGFWLATTRWLTARDSTSVRPHWRYLDLLTMWSLLSQGLLITAAQLADFLYAPTDYILINHFLGATRVADYAPAVQIDAGLLVLVGALASVILPRSAVAHAQGDAATVRRYYLRGTLASFALLAAGGVFIYLLSPLIFRLWLGNSMPATRAILPLVLIHTIVGGSSAVGRSILLGIGKVRPFTASVLIAGVCNVALSYVFVRFLHLGLNGIIYGTIIAVVARCGLWMPWYVMRALPRAQASGGR